MRTTRIRLPIFALMALVAVLGLGFGLIRVAPVGWSRTFYTLTVLAIVLAAVAAWVRPAPAGHFWFGYALVGGVYLGLNSGLMSISPGTWFTYNPYSSSLEGGNLSVLVTDEWLRIFASWVVGPQPVVSGFPDPERFNQAIAQHFARSQSTLIYSHLLFLHVLGLIGGMLALWWTPRPTLAPTPREPPA